MVHSRPPARRTRHTHWSRNDRRTERCCSPSASSSKPVDMTEITPALAQWLEQLSRSLGIDDAGSFLRERTLLVHGVICTFVATPTGLDQVTVLLDAGNLDLPKDDRVLATVASRNLDNFLVGAPIFLFNSESRRLLIGQKFACSDIDPMAFSPMLEGLAMQALAWQNRER
jgi:hypothetical protein